MRTATATQVPRRAPQRRGDAVRARRPLLVVVPDPSVRHARRRLRLATMAVVGATFAALFGVVALHVLLAEGHGGVTQLERRLEEGQEAQQLLRTEVARLESPSVVVAAARDSLGMVEPGDVVTLEPVAPLPTGPSIVEQEAENPAAVRAASGP